MDPENLGMDTEAGSDTGAETLDPMDAIDTLSSLAWSPDDEAEDFGGDDEADPSALDSAREILGEDLGIAAEADGEGKDQVGDDKPTGDDPAPPADPDPAAEEKSLGMPSIPAFTLSEDEYDEAMTDSGKFREIMTRYGEAVAAQTMRHVLSNMGPHVFNIAVGAFDNLSKAQKMFEANPDFEEHPEAFAKALVAERKANPSGSYGDILSGVERRMRSALALRDKVARQRGSRVDARGGAGRVNAPGSGARGSGGSGDTQRDDGDPTFAAFNSVMNRRR